MCLLIALAGAVGVATMAGCGGVSIPPQTIHFDGLVPDGQDQAYLPIELGIDRYHIPRGFKAQFSTGDPASDVMIVAVNDSDDVPQGAPSNPAVGQYYWIGGYQWWYGPGPYWARVIAPVGFIPGKLDVNNSGTVARVTCSSETPVPCAFAAVRGTDRSDTEAIRFDPNASYNPAFRFPPGFTVIQIGVPYYLVIVGYFDWSGFPPTGIELYVMVDLNGDGVLERLVVGTIMVGSDGRPYVIFSQNLLQLLTLIQPGQSGDFTVFFDWGGTTYSFVITLVNGGGGGGGNQPPVANMSLTVQGLTLTGNASNSNDLDGNIEEYKWNFGDGTIVYGVTVSHTYAPGNYRVTLTVTDDDGANSTAYVDITVTGGGGGGGGNGTINVYPEEVR